MIETPESAPEKNVVVNRRARHDYHFVERYEVGIALVGSEVKSIRDSKVSLQDAYAIVEDGEIFIVNMHITPYEKGSHYLPEPKRKRKLLMHKRQIRRLMVRIKEQGLTLIPLQIHFRSGYAKVELGLARGKRKYDKRAAIAKRDAKRDLERAKTERE